MFGALGTNAPATGPGAGRGGQGGGFGRVGPSQIIEIDLAGFFADSEAGTMKPAADHIHPTFSADSTKIEIQSPMPAPDGRWTSVWSPSPGRG
jgi:hypothetical protein